MSRIRIILIFIILIHKGKCGDLDSFKELVTQEIDTLKKQNTIKDQRITNLENDNEALKTQIALLLDKLVILNPYSCPLNQPGYYEFGHRCYFFDKARRNFNDSIAHCATKFGVAGGKLFEPKDLATHNAIREKQVEEIRNSGGNSKHYQTYLGISDQGHEGTFTFVSDDSHLPFTFWKSGQPNDPGSSNYDCVEIYDLPEDKNYGNDRWADIECSGTLFSICEQI